jgi:hypothetical protein
MKFNEDFAEQLYSLRDSIFYIHLHNVNLQPDFALINKELKIHPNNFYAEYILGICLRHNGQTTQANYWYHKSLNDAPCILAERVQNIDGSKSNYTHFGKILNFFSISPKPRTSFNYYHCGSLIYPDIIPDSKGVFYLPIYNMPFVYGYFMGESLSLEDSYPIDQLQRPITVNHNTHVAVMPNIITQKYIPLTINGKLLIPANGDYGTDTDTANPVSVSSKVLHITWPKVENADEYQIMINGYYNDFQFIFDRLPANKVQNEYVIPLESGSPGITNQGDYTFSVTAVKNGKELQRSCPFLFNVPAAKDHIEITAANIEGAALGGLKIESFVKSSTSTTLVYRGIPLKGDYDRFEEMLYNGDFGYYIKKTISPTIMNADSANYQPKWFSEEKVTFMKNPAD